LNFFRLRNATSYLGHRFNYDGMHIINVQAFLLPSAQICKFINCLYSQTVVLKRGWFKSQPIGEQFIFTNCYQL